MSDPDVVRFLDKLIELWSQWDANEDYYLGELAPKIVRSTDFEWLDKEERRVVTALRDLLPPDEWNRLPELLRRRRTEQREEERDSAARRERLRREQREREAARQREREEQEREAASRRAAEEARSARRQRIAGRFEELLSSDFLNADHVIQHDPDSVLLDDAQRRDIRTRFVQRWAEAELKEPLDLDQAAAVAATSGDVLVTARAGSGKTRALVTRAIFLQRHCGVRHDQLMLLAFNRKAAEEMKGRLRRAVGENMPHVMTFHALAYALVQPEEQLIYDRTDAEELRQSREVQDVIDEHIRSWEHRGTIRDIMLAHFREDWEKLTEGRFELAMEDFLEYRRALPRRSLRGESVKSFGEKVIANALFENNVEYKYERNFRWDGVNYRPDFTIPWGTGGIVIEYFGRSGEPDYDEMSDQKRAFWQQRKEWSLIEFAPNDLRAGIEDFNDLLLTQLRSAGVQTRRLTEEEIWERIRKRAVDDFSQAMRTFIGRCRKRRLDVEGLASLVESHRPALRAEELFLRAAVLIYEAYIERLKPQRMEDFDGLIWRAIEQICEGRTQFARDRGRERGDTTRLRFLLIDEFQDFSPMFFELIQAIRSRNHRATLFCVGDDWQAINGFAGSELRFFQNFDQYFQDTSTLTMPTNYRSARAIVGVGNGLMHGRGQEAQAKRSNWGEVMVADLDGFLRSGPEETMHGNDWITPATLRLVWRFLCDEKDVVLLCRTNYVPWYVSGEANRSLTGFLDHVRTFLPEDVRERITASTTHRYKGLERQSVIVLDAIERNYPLIHPNWVFQRVFGDHIGGLEAEERRLFYVAMTRAMDSLVLVTEKGRKSPFLKGIEQARKLTPVVWKDLAPVQGLGERLVEVRVPGAYEVKEELKRHGFAWNAPGKYWYRCESATSFSLDTLCQEPWAQPGTRVEVYDDGGEFIERMTC